mmetsp:Transcript_4952/g.5747  ORF Transcript_4952/g.5747 Transcript_4952/m.5747 type:complete len:124 (-) Transcript_4952:46-417(-)|eukprot:CAMPEP_0194157560 /NCGR_PEP_ID=MMETSP0152-20130528/72483_1 /TAXON_ID=1049557 /ORGANISM="Thalassiothrix antarctica, Strain L6-D1" /LENGTH=123 /DNA_ID=CAMNT_0038866047 /DNA_START=44 /DNA_END=415 /DNA_ORIENTATION=-
MDTDNKEIETIPPDSEKVIDSATTADNKPSWYYHEPRNTTTAVRETPSQIFITNLNPSHKDIFIREKFSEFGEIIHSYRPPIKGSFILTFNTIEASSMAKAKYDNKKLTDDDERNILVTTSII